MGLLEVEFVSVVDKVLELDKPAMKRFMMELVHMIEVQESCMAYVRWSESAKENAAKAHDALVQMLKRMKEES